MALIFFFFFKNKIELWPYAVIINSLPCIFPAGYIFWRIYLPIILLGKGNVLIPGDS